MARVRVSAASIDAAWTANVKTPASLRGGFLGPPLLLGWGFLRGWFRSRFCSGLDSGFLRSGLDCRLRSWLRGRFRGWFGSSFDGWFGGWLRGWFRSRFCSGLSSGFCGWFSGRFRGWFDCRLCSGLSSGFRGWLSGWCSFLSGFFCHVVTPPFRRNSTHTRPAVLGESRGRTSPLHSRGRNCVWHSPIGQALKKA